MNRKSMFLSAIITMLVVVVGFQNGRAQSKLPPKEPARVYDGFGFRSASPEATAVRDGNLDFVGVS